MATKIVAERSPANTRTSGARAFTALLQRVFASADADFSAHRDDLAKDEMADPRDYGRISKLVEDAIRTHCLEAPGQHRDGFLLALSEMICMNVEGCGVDLEWTPSAARKAWAPSFEERARA